MPVFPNAQSHLQRIEVREAPTWETKIGLSEWLNTADQERDLNLLGLKTDFLLDSLRSDSRLAELVRKVGLPQ